MLGVILALSLLLAETGTDPVVDIQASPNPLTRSQVFSLVQNNGGSPSEAGLLTAIAFGPPGGTAESSGNPTVINDTPSTGDYSVGLWQINFRGGVNMPVASSRTLGGVSYTPSGLQQDLNAQAQAALSILRGTGGLWDKLSVQWGAFRANPAGVSAYAQTLTNQLSGTSDTVPTTTTVPGTEGGTTANPSVGLQTDTGTGVQGTTQATAGGTSPPSTTGLNLGLSSSIQHVVFQFLLVLVGLVLLLGGIYLLGSHK